MRLASFGSFGLLVVAALGCAVACGDDDDSSTPNTGGKAGSGSNMAGEGGSTTGGKSGGTSGTTTTEAGAGGAEAGDSQLCTDLGGPANIDAVVRGDGKAATKTDPFNPFRFEKDGRQGSVLLNVATDPCIGQQFAHLLTAPDDLEHLAQCLSLFVQNAAGCNVAYSEDSKGKACKSMAAAHAGLGITDEDYTALITDAAQALIAAGVAPGSPQFNAVAGALTAKSLKDQIITDESAGYSQAGEMCTDEAGGAGAGGAANGGAGGAP